MPPEPQTNPRVFGKYEVIRRLAVGGMGEIFLARQVGMAGFDRLVILKSLLPQLASDPDMLTQFLDEARIVGSINHPNVVACYEVGEWEGVYFIAMEYINGVDVAMLQKAADDVSMRFPVHAAMMIAREAALGLDSAHHANDAQSRALKIVHRDISPHNVMVRQDGLTKIVDFGVAMATNRQKRTEGGLLKGKLGYMAPEQIKGQVLDGRSDQFALGVMLWELLTGRRLFTAEDPHAVFMKIVREVVPPPSSIMDDVPPELDAIVLKMTAQEPADRFGRLAEVAAVLRKLLELRNAMEHETQDLVGTLVGAMLAERVRDLTPSPVRILGVRPKEETGASTQFCSSCGTQSVKGDRFCRSCGTPLAGKRTPSATAPPQLSTMGPPPETGSGPAGPVPVLDEEFTDLADDIIDVTLDDASGPSEAGVCVGQLDLVDGAGTHIPPEPMMRPVFAHLEELAARFGGAMSTSGPRFTATFSGNGRAARSGIAFARRAGAIAARAHRDLRLKAAVSGSPALVLGDVTAKDDAERCLARAASGAVLVTEGARKISSATHAWTTRIVVPAQAGAEEVTAWQLPAAPRVAGRAHERTLIEQAVAASDVGRGQQHLFLGDAGLGKTTLLQLVDAEVRDRGFVVARVRCGALRAPVRYDGVRQAVKSACLELVSLSGAAGPWTKGLEGLGLGPHERRRLESLVDDAGPEPADDDVPLARRRVLLRGAILGFFGALAERRGVCVLIDDIHKGDPSSLEVFAEVGARHHSARLAIFAAGRPMHGERVLPFAKRVVLEPLDARDTAQVAALAIGGTLADDVGERIAARAAGNPLFAALLARHLVGIQMLHVVGTAVTASPDLKRYPMPPSVDVLLFAMHALLPPEGREVILAAAQLGSVFDVADVSTALDADAKPGIAACIASGALVDESTPGGEGRCSFPTATERDLVASRADPHDATGWHSAVAASLESRQTAMPAGQPEKPAETRKRSVHVDERLVLHLTAAGERARAALVDERCAEAWARLGAAEATAEHWRRALQARWKQLGTGAASPDLTSALDVATRATSVLGEVDAAAAVDLAMPIVRLLPEGQALTTRAEALRVRAGLLLKLRRTEEATRALDEVLHALPADAPPALRGSVLLDVALATEQAGNPDGARVQLQEALRVMATEKRAPTRAGEALLALGRLQLRARELPAARESLTQALAEARERGSMSSQIDVLAALSSLTAAEGKPDRALTLLDDALALAGRAGDGVIEARTRQQLARTHQGMGKVTEALAAARLSFSTAARLAWDEGTAVAGQLVTTLERR